MIVGQLIQAGKRFCEHRPNHFLPKSDLQHTFLAYNVMDELDIKTFDESAHESQDTVHQWLIESDSIAYIIISRRFDNLQTEFPTPIGTCNKRTITITAATSTCLAQMNFVNYGELSELPLKLINSRESHTKVNFTLKNFFNEAHSHEISNLIDFDQFTFPELRKLAVL